MNKRLLGGIESLGLDLQPQQQEKLNELLEQLLKWNQAFNLTAIKDEDEAVKLHLLDSLAIVPHWSFSRTLDVGTGAGFPGLPLAIALPDQEFHLLDSNSKKIRFIRQQIHHLGLTNVTAHHSRVEQHQADGYDCVVSRAFASLSDMVNWTKHLLTPGCKWMAMKGVFDQSEVDAIPQQAVFEDVFELTIPRLDADRCLIKLGRTND
ncbi:16S rRNA (guanine(527)-N(7))-methyltransferase RsmG [Aliikangiella sp. G2MR2-5]|uniref:16S rRNA (guanine(527)-N(7))-methyltransferase RsmG n=1 Tax=Aliikangiella sp. G2MR2-5 TaxID=2788943 RepID=UPI0018AC2CD2|nr:16S rRNA (guanine(527)-N(7))-methyltransferase RsmG [Aliikangiella sp. G2MR2-5]